MPTSPARSRLPAGFPLAVSLQVIPLPQALTVKASAYDILGVAKNATDAEVKKAYRQLALKWHPDKHPDDKDRAEAMFISITEDYEYIIGDTSRKKRAGQT